MFQAQTIKTALMDQTATAAVSRSVAIPESSAKEINHCRASVD